ncbi:MAG TPA: hypothetical protein VGQ59_20920 [Cyclobacteriaceae bacterium]|nr:hypothetical protein [Cyclobacteriaceae bacterium]
MNTDLRDHLKFEEPPKDRAMITSFAQTAPAEYRQDFLRHLAWAKLGE